MNQALINGILCILSFGMYFAALYMDAVDVKNGNFLRRIKYVLCVLINVSFMFRLGAHYLGGILVFWFLVSLATLVSKYIQLQGNSKAIRDHIKQMSNAMKSGKRVRQH
jgi:hypothetical protein